MTAEMLRESNQACEMDTVADITLVSCCMNFGLLSQQEHWARLLIVSSYV